MQDQNQAVPPQPSKRTASAARAREVHWQKSAIRALDDPVKLASAARIVRVALERGKLSIDDLTPGDQQQTAKQAS